jgi:GGDEF domain-containing protein
LLGDRIDEGEFDQYEREHIINIAVLASIAINNAFLFEMTTTDMMTKLKMKHYFYTTLLERMEAVSETNAPLSIVMMDIDYFKKFNDTYGHSCGMRSSSAWPRRSRLRAERGYRGALRRRRIRGAYGRYRPPEATLAAERIRQGVADAVTEYRGSSSMSRSPAAWRDTIPTGHLGQVLIDRADRALYRSKQEGRNRVSVSE